jgi:hypothetical protein
MVTTSTCSLARARLVVAEPGEGEQDIPEHPALTLN